MFGGKEVKGANLILAMLDQIMTGDIQSAIAHGLVSFEAGFEALYDSDEQYTTVQPYIRIMPTVKKE